MPLRQDHSPSKNLDAVMAEFLALEPGQELAPGMAPDFIAQFKRCVSSESNPTPRILRHSNGSFRLSLPEGADQFECLQFGIRVRDYFDEKFIPYQIVEGFQDSDRGYIPSVFALDEDSMKFLVRFLVSHLPPAPFSVCDEEGAADIFELLDSQDREPNQPTVETVGDYQLDEYSLSNLLLLIKRDYPDAQVVEIDLSITGRMVVRVDGNFFSSTPVYKRKGDTTNIRYQTAAANDEHEYICEAHDD